MCSQFLVIIVSHCRLVLSILLHSELATEPGLVVYKLHFQHKFGDQVHLGFTYKLRTDYTKQIQF